MLFWHFVGDVLLGVLPNIVCLLRAELGWVYPEDDTVGVLL